MHSRKIAKPHYHISLHELVVSTNTLPFQRETFFIHDCIAIIFKHPICAICGSRQIAMRACPKSKYLVVFGI